MTDYASVINTVALPPGTTPWPTRDPFLFCVHHLDTYPEGNGEYGPNASLQGRAIGQDFAGIDGWRMYHGQTVPGFPSHPHRGFETVTIVRTGLLDHADSTGAAARYGQGDVQWLTAGAGIQHAEMFPLLNEDARNPVELFQIWVNLPRVNKFAKPHFSMMWNDTIPLIKTTDSHGNTTTIRVIAGRHGSRQAPSPPPASWAAHADSDLAIMTLKLDPFAEAQLPEIAASTHRSLYFFKGNQVTIAGRSHPVGQRLDLDSTHPIHLTNGDAPSELLLLAARPIGEPVVQYGPFVMNTASEIHEAFADYRRTGFGGWPWPNDDPVHGNSAKRFARHGDGTYEEPS